MMGSCNVNFVCFVILCVSCNKLTEATPKYSDDEKAAIVKFRALVKDDLYRDYMKSDPYLVRWLGAKEFNQNDAAVMLRKAMKWRKDNKIDGILNEVVPAGAPPFFTDGIDNEGSVVLTLAIHFDTRTFVVTGKGNTLIRYFARVMELAEQNIMRNLGVIGNDTLEGNATDHLNLIVNVQGYNLRQHACLRCFPIYLAWTEIYEHFYPAYVKHLFIINAPRIVAPLVEFLKPLMSPQTRNAFKVYGHKTEWQPAIIGKIIPTNQVRAAFGGTKAN